MNKLNILLICDLPKYGTNANTIVHHINAFRQYSKHNLFLMEQRGVNPCFINLNRFDVIIIHYSIFVLSEVYLHPKMRKKIKKFSGLKIQFIQDEYRFINDINKFIADVGIDVLYSCQPKAVIDKIYPKTSHPHLKIIETLTGYIEESLLKDMHHPPIQDRALDVVYRGRTLPYWLGSAHAEKKMIGEDFKTYCKRKNISLKMDISAKETDRIYGKEWIKFLQSSKTTLGVESKGTLFDFTGDIYHNVEKYMQQNPQATYEEVEAKYFPGQDGQLQFAVISPRIFEAVMLKTVIILYEGHYSGILTPWRHYLPLKKDLSNIETIIALISDNHAIQQIADTAFSEIALNPHYSYTTFMQNFDEKTGQAFSELNKTHASIPYSTNKFNSRKFFSEYITMFSPTQIVQRCINSLNRLW